MLKTVNELDIKDKRVLVRVDFNVPIDEKGEITDDFRIRSALPTIQYLMDNGAKQVVLMSHLDPWKETPASTKDSRLKMDNVADALSGLLDQDVAKVDDCVDVELPDSKLVVLENLRFHKEEKKNDDGFSKKLAKNGEVYVNDAFGTCHRAHASVEGVVKYFKDYGAGLLVQREVEMLNPVLQNPEHPLYVILAGAKVSSKIGVIEKMAESADKLFIGGKMALAFVGVDYIDEEERAKAKELLGKYGSKLVLPVDYVTEDEVVVGADAIPEGKNIFDVGPKTTSLWKQMMDDAKTIVSNGILGYFEKPPFDTGTNEMMKYMAQSSATTILGGGDSASAAMHLGLQDKISHVSTGGGASLEFLEGKELPGLKVLGLYN